MSGNEKSDDEEKKKENTSKRKSIKESAKPYEVSNRLYDQNKIKLKAAKKASETNTEFNNKRFEKDKSVNYNYIIKEESFQHNNSSGKKRIKTNNVKKLKINEHLIDVDKAVFNGVDDDDEEEEIKCVPKPIDVHGNNLNKNVKINDFRKIRIENNFKQEQSHLYMPDFKAKKIVEEILQKKLNEDI